MDFESAIKNDASFSAERVSALRKSLSLDSPDMVTVLEQSEFVSLGGFCGVSSALGSLGLRKAAQPFDWVRSSSDGVLQCIETEFRDFLSFKTSRMDSGHKVFEDTSWGGSFWHHDIEEPTTRDQFSRRIERFLCKNQEVQSPAPRFFVRVANSAVEVGAASRLLEALQRKFHRSPVYLLVLMDMQKVDGLVRVQDTSSHLLFHRIHEDLWLNSVPDVSQQMRRCSEAYAKCIAAAVQHWAKGFPTQYIVPDIATLEVWVDKYDGGDAGKEGYSPQGKIGYMVLQQGSNPGDVVRAGFFGSEWSVTIPQGASVGSVLELRLANGSMSVKLGPNADQAALMTTLTGAAATAASMTTSASASTPMQYQLPGLQPTGLETAYTVEI
jgi:hypothetical protein